MVQLKHTQQVFGIMQTFVVTTSKTFLYSFNGCFRLVDKRRHSRSNALIILIIYALIKLYLNNSRFLEAKLFHPRNRDLRGSYRSG